MELIGAYSCPDIHNDSLVKEANTSGTTSWLLNLPLKAWTQGISEHGVQKMSKCLQ